MRRRERCAHKILNGNKSQNQLVPWVRNIQNNFSDEKEEPPFSLLNS